MLLTLVRTQQHLVSHYNHKENKHDKENNIYLVKELVELPYVTNIKPSGTGEGPLANIET